MTGFADTWEWKHGDWLRHIDEMYRSAGASLSQGQEPS